MSQSTRIHPTALVSPEAQLAADVTVGPFAVIEGPVKLGQGCVVRQAARLEGDVAAGGGNDFGVGCVIGERPQHRTDAGEGGAVVIGEGNVFREHATVHRGTSGGRTVIGDDNYFMINTHIGHDCRVGDGCTLANGVLLGGHAEVFDGVFMGGNAAVHQYTRLGRLSLLSGVSGASKDVPPFIMQQLVNRVEGVNLVGMRRAGFDRREIDAVRRAYQLLYLSGLTVKSALARLEAELADSAAVAEMIAFIRDSKRGVCGSGRVIREAA